MPALFEILSLKSDVSELPHPDSPYFFVASDGLYSRRQTAVGIVTQKEKEWPKHLKKADIKVATLKYTAPKIPKGVIERAWGFFRYALAKNNSEAEVLILWNDTTNKFRLFAPHQECTYASVHSLYDPGDIPEKFQVIGSIHSHCDMDAFHSGTDTDDASNFNGVHITIGHVSSDKPSFAAMVMMNGNQWDFDIEAIAVVESISPKRFPNAWTTVFGTHEEILKRDFKTLTKEDLDAWTESLRPKVVISKPKQPNWRESNKQYSGHWWNDDDDPYGDPDSMAWWYRSSFGSGVSTKKSEYKNTKYDDTKYSYETRGYVPREWLTTTGSLKEAYVELAFERQLVSLFDAAVARGVWIKYELETMTKEEVESLSTLIDQSPSMGKGSEFLPGPFSVKNEE
jgi:PRTRC genetic system protein A